MWNVKICLYSGHLDIQFEVQEIINIRNIQLGSITVEIIPHVVKTTKMYKVIGEKLQSERRRRLRPTQRGNYKIEELNPAIQIKKAFVDIQ